MNRALTPSRCDSGAVRTRILVVWPAGDNLIGPPELSAVLQAQPGSAPTAGLLRYRRAPRKPLRIAGPGYRRIDPFWRDSGQALIHRVEADPNLADTRIWIVSPDGAARCRPL